MSEAISFHVISDEINAQKIWRMFSPDKILHDSWEFRSLFHAPFKYPLHFICAQKHEEPIGLIALQHNTTDNRFEFFGGMYMEDNRIYLRDSTSITIQDFLAQVPSPAFLSDIVSPTTEHHGLAFEEYKYVLSLEGLSSAESHFERHFEGKSKANFRKRIKKAKEFGVKVVDGMPQDLERLFELNIKNFKDESSFNFPKRKEIFRSLLSSNLNVHLISFVIDDQPQAVSLAVQWKETYVYINAGTNWSEYPNLGSLVIFENIQRAIDLGCTLFDAEVEDLGWKELWKLTKVPLYKYQC